MSPARAIGGFTLVEMLITVAIVAILSMGAVPFAQLASQRVHVQTRDGVLPGVLSMLLGFTAWLVTFGIEHLDGRLPEAVFAAVTTVPSDFWGLGFSIVGYVVGQALSPQRPEAMV